MTETTEPKGMVEILCKGFFPDFLLNDADGNMLSDSEASYIWNSDNRLVRVEKTIDDCKHDKNRKGHGYGHLKHSKESVAYEEYTYLPQDWRRITRKTGKIQSDSKKRFGCNPKSEELTYVSIYDGADESHEYLVTEPKFKFRGRCKPAKPQLKIFREFIGGPGSDDIAYTRYNHLSLAMLKDGLGSTIALTSKDGKAIARIGYDAWGEFRWDGRDNHAPCKDEDFDNYLDRLENTWGFGRGNHNGWAFGKHFGSKLTPYLYTGRRYSSFTNQYFNRNRYYSPALGRFTSKDPIGFNGGMNLYRYADNNPMLFTDPFGRYSVPFPSPTLSYRTTLDPKKDTSKFVWYIQWLLDLVPRKGLIIQEISYPDVEILDEDDIAKEDLIEDFYFNHVKEPFYFWEAWVVSPGLVNSEVPYADRLRDIWRLPDFGKSKGTVTIEGIAKYYDEQELPSSFSVTRQSPSFSRPATRTDPGLIGGSNPVKRRATYHWNYWCPSENWTKIE